MPAGPTKVFVWSLGGRVPLGHKLDLPLMFISGGRSMYHYHNHYCYLFNAIIIIIIIIIIVIIQLMIIIYRYCCAAHVVFTCAAGSPASRSPASVRWGGAWAGWVCLGLTCVTTLSLSLYIYIYI